MIDPDLKKELDTINSHLAEINRKASSSVWKSFFAGALSGSGSVIGAAIAIVIIGWILNTVGFIPALKSEVTRLNDTLDQLRKTK